jgi:hypothetical protein
MKLSLTLPSYFVGFFSSYRFGLLARLLFC